MTTTLQPWEQLPMYVLSDGVAARVDELGDPHLHFDTHKVFRMTAMAKR